MSEDSNQLFLKERHTNNGKDFTDGSVKIQHSYVENNALLEVIVETDDKPFIYDVHENPPILMTIFFAMQVRHICFIYSILRPYKSSTKFLDTLTL